MKTQAFKGTGGDDMSLLNRGGHQRKALEKRNSSGQEESPETPTDLEGYKKSTSNRGARKHRTSAPVCPTSL
jgi:hypothetical protein